MKFSFPSLSTWVVGTCNQRGLSITLTSIRQTENMTTIRTTFTSWNACSFTNLLVSCGNFDSACKLAWANYWYGYCVMSGGRCLDRLYRSSANIYGSSWQMISLWLVQYCSQRLRCGNEYCDKSVALVTNCIKRSNIEMDSTFIMLQALALHSLIFLSLDNCPDSGGGRSDSWL